jgi:hypothetical protein
MLVVKGAATRVEGHSPGWSAKVTVSGPTERSLTDDGATLPGIAQAYPRTAPAVRRAVGDTAASISQQAVRHYVTAFFNLHLRGISTAFAARPAPGVSIETSTPESR